MGVWVGSNRGRPKMTGGSNLGHPHAWLQERPRGLHSQGRRGGTVGASVADPACRFYRCGPTRAPAAHLHGLTCAPAALRVHQAELPSASRQAAPSPVSTRAVHLVNCRDEFPSGRRPLMNDIGADGALGPLRTRSARPCGSLMESGPNLDHWKTVATFLRAR